MRTAVIVLAFTGASIVFVAAAGLAWSAEREKGTAQIIAEVGPLKNLKGFLRCQLFKTEKGFPSERDQAIAREDHKPASNTVTCRFANLSPGTYAVAVLHDEDADGEMDTNFVGIPQEGYGASNNKLPSLSAPSFADSSFKLSPGEDKTLKVTVKY